MQMLAPEQFSDVIVYFDEDLRGEILENYTGKEIAQVVVDNMDTDDAADLISELPEEKKREVSQPGRLGARPKIWPTC